MTSQALRRRLEALEKRFPWRSEPWTEEEVRAYHAAMFDAEPDPSLLAFLSRLGGDGRAVLETLRKRLEEPEADGRTRREALVDFVNLKAEDLYKAGDPFYQDLLHRHPELMAGYLERRRSIGFTRAHLWRRESEKLRESGRQCRRGPS